MKTIDISGFGPGPDHPYEKCCQRMLKRALEHLEKTGLKLPEKFSWVDPIPEIKALTKAMDGGEGVTGAMMFTVLGHVAFINRNGREKWLKEFETDPSRIYEIED